MPYVQPNGTLAHGAPILANTDAYQVLDKTGAVLAHSRSLTTEPLITQATFRKAVVKPVRQDIGPLLPIHNRPLRAYAVPLPHGHDQRAAVLVVAVRRDHRDEALLELLASTLTVKEIAEALYVSSNTVKTQDQDQWCGRGRWV